MARLVCVRSAELNFDNHRSGDPLDPSRNPNASMKITTEVMRLIERVAPKSNTATQRRADKDMPARCRRLRRFNAPS